MSRAAVLADRDVPRIIETDRHGGVAGRPLQPLGAARTEPVEVLAANERAAARGAAGFSKYLLSCSGRTGRGNTE